MNPISQISISCEPKLVVHMCILMYIFKDILDDKIVLYGTLILPIYICLSRLNRPHCPLPLLYLVGFAVAGVLHYATAHNLLNDINGGSGGGGGYFYPP